MVLTASWRDCDAERHSDHDDRVTRRSPQANGRRRGTDPLDLGPLACCADARSVSFLGLDLNDEAAARGSDVILARQTAVAHGFEALVKPCKRKLTVAEELSGRWPCRDPLDVRDTITLTKLHSLSVQDTKEY